MVRVYLTRKKRAEQRSKSDVNTDVFDFNENKSKISSTRGIENNDSSAQSQLKSLQPGRSDDDCSRQLHSPVLTDCVHDSNLPLTSLIPAPGELCGACDLAESNAMDTSCSRPMSSDRSTGRVPKSTSSSLRVPELNKSSVKQVRHCWWDRRVNAPVPVRGWSRNINSSSWSYARVHNRPENVPVTYRGWSNNKPPSNPTSSPKNINLSTPSSRPLASSWSRGRVLSGSLPALVVPFHGSNANLSGPCDVPVNGYNKMCVSTYQKSVRGPFVDNKTIISENSSNKRPFHPPKDNVITENKKR